MEALAYSFIIPVYNRPNEIDELLQSFLQLETNLDYEIVIVEDGSTNPSSAVIKTYADTLNIAYLTKPNSGPGDSRNYGMQRAKGNYFIILDSDIIFPKHYLNTVNESLTTNYVDCFGGPDAAHHSFTNLQKAINFSMTSVITTGGIRGGKQAAKQFQPRSFNMGLSKKAFQATGGFGKIHPGEDPDLSIRLKKQGFKLNLIPEAFVYHKRRISWSKFYTQVYKFGSARTILNTWHPQTKRFIYWLPTIFSLGLIVSILLAFYTSLFLMLYVLFFGTVFISSFLKTKNISVAILSSWAVLVQFFGYGYGFLKSTLKLGLSKHKKAEDVLPHLFF